ncbi:conserved unknown protein [Ectocarpus siliculosus]|uniref:TOG domain-containing protein n=1 Tax=Ectocarpus siliculosus TaxID=2880 RepID=D7FSR2_ECTSI|nr:conserved unknown protein [Ectocarpus siliculosus]|eukprot:CBJ31203.1 conserved unknown protein [Ectocarpus siliculosus]
MRAYSPPVTRQRARAIILGQAAQRSQREQPEQQGQARQAQGSRSSSRSSGGRVRRREQEQGASESLPNGAGAGGTGGGAEESDGGRSERVASGGSPGSFSSSRTAGTRSESTATVGNTASRWRRGGGRRNPSVEAEVEITKGLGGGGGGGDGGGSKVAVAEATCGLGDQGVDADGDDGVASSSVAAAFPGAPRSSSSSSSSQPLEEVNPSVLNAKDFSSGSSSSGGVDAGADGKEGGSSVASTAPSSHHEPPRPSSQSDREDGGRPAIGGPRLLGGSTTAGAVPLPAALSGDGADGAAVDGDADSPNHGGVLPIPPPARGPSATAAGVARAVADRRDRSSSGGAVRGRSCAAAAGGGEGGGDMDGSPERGVKPPAAEAEGGGSGGGAGLGSRLNGKSVLAKGSTGVSPMQKRNRRELKLSEEETAMAGAPQGPVYQVAVLETGDFEPSPNPDEEMQAVRAASAGDGDWADLYSAVDSARRLCIFHAQKLLVPGGQGGGGAGGSGDGGDADGNLEGVVGLLAAAVGNLRSSMVRNALLGVGDIFRFLKHDVGRVDISPMIAGTLQRLAGDKRFICQTAAQAMEAAARNGPGADVLHAILPSLDDRNAEVAAKSAFYAEQCLAALGVGSKAGVGLPEALEFRSMLPGMSRALNGKVAEGRASARRALLRCRKAMGLGPFEAAVKSSLEKAEATSLLTVLATPNRTGAAAGAGKAGPGRAPILQGRRGGAGTGRGGGVAARPSIREQMMAARRKKGQAEGGSGGGGEGFVVVS